MKLNVFIDTNIFLSFYSLSEDDINTLEKILKLIDDDEIEIILPSNVIDEYNKNRLNKIYSTTSTFQSLTDFSIPTIYKQYPETQNLQTKRRELSAIISLLKEKLKEDIANHNLSADKIVSEIFKRSKIFYISDEIFEKAERRFKRHLPPRKKDSGSSIGDAINWETLKKAIREGDIHIISEDGDFRDSIGEANNVLKYFLADEWLKIKMGKHIYITI